MKLSKEGALRRLVEFGQEVKVKSNPGMYSVEKHHWAERYKKMLPPLRRAYVAIRDGDNVAGILKWLVTEEIVTGIECNHLNLLLKAVTGTLPERETGWNVVNDELVYISPWQKSKA